MTFEVIGPILESSTPTRPPSWAVLERALIDAIDAAAPIFLEKYTRPGGALIWQEEYPGDGVWADDLYEAFFNWSFHHALGGSDYVGAKSLVEWNAITRQLAHDYGRVYREFINDDDWFHNAENYIYFYGLGLVDPTVRDNRDRAQRFAGFYTGQDPEAPCYDPAHRIIRSPFSGSKGPLFHARWADVHYNLVHEHTTLGPGVELSEGWETVESDGGQIHDIFDRVVMNSDVVVNLSVVPLIASAFAYTGQEKYRRWICDYVEAWIERTRANDGIIPDNVGPTGAIGENRHSCSIRPRTTCAPSMAAPGSRALARAAGATTRGPGIACGEHALRHLCGASAGGGIRRDASSLERSFRSTGRRRRGRRRARGSVCVPRAAVPRAGSGHRCLGVRPGLVGAAGVVNALD